jgi:GSH-dependent disulfide-bond oxidoreductase
MIDLYAAPTANGLRAKIMLDECALPYTLHKIDLTKGEQKSADFLKMNPIGSIPVIVDNDGPGGKPVTMAQSVAILMYLGEKAGKFIPKDPGKRGVFLEALMIAATDVGPTLGTVNLIVRSKEVHKPTLELFEGRFRNYFTVWNDKFSHQRYAVDDEVSIADFALYSYFARCSVQYPTLLAGLDNVGRWGKEIGARPGVAKGMNFG